MINALLDLVLELDTLHRRARLRNLRALLPEVLLRSRVQLREGIFGLGCAREKVFLHLSHSLHCVGLRAWSLQKTLGA